MRPPSPSGSRIRVPLAVVTVAVAIVLAGCGGGLKFYPDATPSDAAGGQGAEAGLDEPEALPTNAPTAFKEIHLKGKGSKRAKFKIPQDAAAIAVISHKGKRSFIVDAIDKSGDLNEGLVNEVGSYKGTVLFDEEDGQHSAAFEIKADGAWTITIRPITKAKKWDPRKTLTGKGDAVYQVSPAPNDPVSIALEHQGKRRFVVRAYGQRGRNGLADTIGDYGGEALLPPGTFLVTIEATGGRWSLTPG